MRGTGRGRSTEGDGFAEGSRKPLLNENKEHCFCNHTKAPPGENYFPKQIVRGRFVHAGIVGTLRVAEEVRGRVFYAIRL